ncbi:MAG: hypothetical protein U0270_16690 [Labilithrix sp.]
MAGLRFASNVQMPNVQTRRPTSILVTVASSLLAVTLAACSSDDTGGGSSGTSGSSGSSGAGSTPLGGTLCSVPDLEAAGGGFGVSRIRVSDDGSVYLLFDHAVHRYTVTAGTTCTFTKDAAFGTSGGVSADTFDLGAPGKLVVQTFFALEVHDRVTGALTYSCDADSVGRVGVSPDGTAAYALGFTSPAKSRKYVLGAAGCTSSEAWTPSSPWSTMSTGYAQSVVVLADSVVVGAQSAVFVYGLDGAQKAVFGQSESPQDWDTFGIAYLNDIIVTSAGVDAVDTNSPNVRRYDLTGKFVRRWNITDLTGLPDTGTFGPRPDALGVAPGGERYLAITTGDKRQIWRIPAF